MSARPCSTEDCDGQLGRDNKSGRCRRCTARALSQTPGWREKQQAGVDRRRTDPAKREVMVATARRINIAWRATPEGAAKLRAIASTTLETARSDPEVRARWLARRAEAARKRRETMLGWCPLEYRDHYLDLLKKVKKAEAQGLIRDLIAADARRYALTGELQAARRAA